MAPLSQAASHRYRETHALALLRIATARTVVSPSTKLRHSNGQMSTH